MLESPLFAKSKNYRIMIPLITAFRIDTSQHGYKLIKTVTKSLLQALLLRLERD